MDTGKLAIRKFGKRVKELRIERRWSQEELAFELDVDRSYVSSLERGQRNPTLKTIARVAKALRTTVCNLCSDF
ncbi:MAG: helix-turn-helix transcriptional regulator [Candidatus Melainabacteria bacterium]|nr:helix-turn-helix transcriptional regulator [Candidatus Melainabacteria bacterium]